jgi:hypothetical protein
VSVGKLSPVTMEVFFLPFDSISITTKQKEHHGGHQRDDGVVIAAPLVVVVVKSVITLGR